MYVVVGPSGVYDEEKEIINVDIFISFISCCYICLINNLESLNVKGECELNCSNI